MKKQYRLATFAQSSGNVQELQHNNDSQSQIAPQISKEDENDWLTERVDREE